MALKVDQRAYKNALHEAIDSFSGRPSVTDVVDKVHQAALEHPNYVNNKAIHARIHELLLENNPERAKKLVGAIEDVTVSRAVIGVFIAGKGLFYLAAVALVVGLAVFLFQHFVG